MRETPTRTLVCLLKLFEDYFKRLFLNKYYTSTVCGGTLRATTGLIRPPTSGSQYLPNQNCTWYITVTAGTSVRLSFAQFNLEASSACKNDYVLIRNGHAPDSPVLGSPFCGSTIPSPITAPNSKVSVQFVTNSVNQASGFWLNYTQFVQGMGLFYHATYLLPLLSKSFDIPI